MEWGGASCGVIYIYKRVGCSCWSDISWCGMLGGGRIMAWYIFVVYLLGICFWYNFLVYNIFGIYFWE